jgi:hypothetical protein
MSTDPLTAKRKGAVSTAARFGSIAATAVVILLPLVMAVRAGASVGSWFDDSLIGWGMWGLFSVYVGTRPGWREAWSVIGAASILRAVHFLVANEHVYPGCAIIPIGSYLPFFCIPLLAWRAYRYSHEPKYRLALVGVFLFTYTGLCLGFYISFAKVICHYKLDRFLYAFDGALGSHFNFMLGELSSRFQPVYVLFATSYDSLGFFFALLFAGHINLPGNRLNILKLNVANAILGYSLFFLYPAMGPKYAFPSFPHLPAGVTVKPILVAGVPNAMPSLNVGCALFIFFLSRPWKWPHRFAGVFLLLTLLAVFGTGEHYEVDAIVALPYSLMVMAFASTVTERRSVLVINAAMLGIWVLVLRSGDFNPWISWSLVVNTIALGWIVERRFARSLWSPAILRSPVPVNSTAVRVAGIVPLNSPDRRLIRA